VGAKTGTTQQWKDGWTLGYTPSLVAGVWTGNNGGELMKAGADGVLTAAPIWNQFMRNATAGTEVETFRQPDGIQRLYVDSLSGKLPTQYTPSTKEEVFAQVSVPDESDDVHIAVEINSVNGMLATDDTPDEYRETRVYTVLHSEVPDNPNWEYPVRAWAQAAGYEYPPSERDDGSTDPDFVGTRISFNTPRNSQQVPPNFTVKLDVLGDEPEDIELYFEGTLVGTRSRAPYTFQVTDAPTGWKTLIAIANLEDGERMQQSIRIEVVEGAVQNNQEPIVNDDPFVLPFGLSKKNKPKN
jgi:membrane carboxypeptidase/penicillin-binding protein PbpC